MYPFSKLFGNLIGEEMMAVFSDAVIEKCDLNSEKRELNIVIKSENYINRDTLFKFRNHIKIALNLNEVQTQITFNKASFCKEACADITEEIKHLKPALNGYFNGAEYETEGDTCIITLGFGGMKTITECEFEKHFKILAKKSFGIDTEVRFAGQLEDVEMEVPIAPVEESRPQKKKEVAEEPEKEYDYIPKDGLPVYLESAKLFFGRKINTDVMRLSDIVPPDMDGDSKVFIAAWGEVFGLETKVNDSRSGGKIAKVKFYISDNTSSISAVITKFFDPRYSKNMDEDANEFMNSLAKLSNGSCVVVNGDYCYDNWSHEYVLQVKSLASVKKYEPKDDYEGEKRVELHCHTNMSANDGVVSATDLINRAYKWGHKAIAITDHGVAQAYPEVAMAVSKIRKKGGEFKAIYGIESYFIDDTRHNLDGLTNKEIGKLSNHQIILVKNLTGLRNLYELISDANLNHYHGAPGRPIVMRSVLDKLRDGLILGSACEAGELYKAIVDGKPDEELMEIADYYDYLEIQPLTNNEYMVRDSGKEFKDKKGVVQPNRFKHVTSFEVIKDFNRKVVEIADKLNKPVVATGDVHFLNKEDTILRQIVMAGKGFSDIEFPSTLYLKSTAEMLSDFDYFGDRAYEFVVENPNKIADMISDDVIPVPEGNFPPVIEGSDEELQQICWDNARKKYGDPVPEIVAKRLEKELTSIINNGFSIMYISAQKLVAYSEEQGYLVGSRGSVGSSFVATMAGISEVNPLAPHYVCPNCQYSEFFTDGSVGSGFDLPEKNCPHCNTPLNRDGHDIPFETFLGFKGDKVPDIDLNFSGEVQNTVQEYTKTLFGEENVFRAGTISTIAEQTAFGYTKKFIEHMQTIDPKYNSIIENKAEIARLASKVKNAGVKSTTGQHPAGMIIVPNGMKIYDFCPVQHPADDVKSTTITTHFDFHSIHDTILKLDELGHDVPTIYKYLEEYSGINVNDISMSDPKVYSLFTSTEALGVTADEINSKTGTFCLPEFGTSFVRGMLVDCKPKNFADLLQISGLSHGTDVYLGNAKDLIDNGTCTISEVIGTRDNIMVYLIHQGMEEGRAFKITETVRKGLVASGKVSKEDWAAMEDDMRKVNVPEWYIESCHKIKYMFPKAHAAAYVISAIKLGWYKIYEPLAFYCAYFTARPEDVDVPVIVKGRDAIRRAMNEILAKGKEASKKELDVYEILLVFNEILARGIKVLPPHIKKSHAMKFLPEDGAIRLPFGAVSGVGEKAAYSIYEAAQRGNFVSREDFAIEAGVSKTVLQNLVDLGALGDLPDTNQISMF